MKPHIESPPLPGVSIPLSESGVPSAPKDAIVAATQDLAHQEKLDRLQRELNRALHEREQIETAFRQLSAEYNAEKYRVLRPLWRRILRCGGKACRLVLPERAVNKLKSLLPDSEGVPSRLTFSSFCQAKDSGDAVSIGEVQPPCAKPDIFILSIIEWGFRRQRPQQLAAQFAKHHRVFYIEMLPSTAGVKFWKVGEKLYRVRFPRAGVGGLTAYSGVANAAQLSMFQKTFADMLRDVCATEKKYIVIQHPYWWQFASRVGDQSIVIYDCMDDIAGFANTTPAMLENEQQLLSGSDVLVVSSQRLYEKHSGHPARHLIRNACDDCLCAVDQTRKPWPQGISAGSHHGNEPAGISVGYVGAIAEWFDFPLVASIARRNPVIHFHLFGSATTKEVCTLAGLANVTLYGEIHHSDVPAVISNMDVMFIPFRLIPIIQACDPIKFYEHCAMGKPTVATRLPELERVKELVLCASTPDECALQIRNAASRSRDDSFRHALKVFAAANTWAERGSQYERVLSGAVRRTVSKATA